MQGIRIPKSDVDTPALLVDHALLKQNIHRMAAYAAGTGISLRPHAKTHKSPRIAAMQLEAGAIGITCQKLGEAEVMARHGIGSLLVANQIVGPQKIARLMAVANTTDITVAADDLRNVRELSVAAVAHGVTVGVLVEVDIGTGRCGVRPGEPALELARAVSRSPGLQFRGLMGYEGHVVLIDDREERTEKARECLARLVDTAELLRSRGMEVPIVSSSGTGTYDIGGSFPGITEIQPGSYVTMDSRYKQVGVPFECALSVLTTVISTPSDTYAVTDAGLKSITSEFGLPLPLGLAGARVAGLSEEHCRIRFDEPHGLIPGDKVELLPTHGCTTINLHDWYHVVSEGSVIGRWPVAARGCFR